MKTKFLKGAAAVLASAMVVGTAVYFPEVRFPQVRAAINDGEIEISTENFPDDIFREYVSANFDLDKNGGLSDEEISQATSISVENCGIESLEGIECFTELRYLYCSSNQLTELDVSNNPNLEDLRCDNNKIMSLDVSIHTALRILMFDSNQLTKIDVSNNPALEWFSCEYNKLTELDLSNNPNLTHLWCRSNQLTSLDISDKAELDTLWCGFNQIVSLDVSNNAKLKYLHCDNNMLTSLDVSNNIILDELHCGNNPLSSLDISKNTELRSLECYTNQLAELDISQNTKLSQLNCHDNQLTELDVSKHTELLDFYCHSNQLTELDISQNTELRELRCYSNRLTSLDVSNNTALTRLDCYDNQFDIGEICGEYDLEELPEGFDITKASDWQGAELVDGKLTEIDGSGTITYNYDCGNGESATFSLSYTPTEHSYDEGVVTVEPTEETEGEIEYTCTVCGKTKTEVLDKLPHTHNPADKLTSDETGHWYECSGCDEKLDFAEHTEDDGTVTVEATEESEGEKVYKCTECGYTTKTETLEKLPHTHKPADKLTSDETGHWYECSGCDEKLDFAAHTEDNGTVTVEATEETEGEKVYKCTECGYTTRTETVEKVKNDKEINIDLSKNGWGNHVKEIDAAEENSTIKVEMGNTTNVPKNVLEAIEGRDIDLVLDMGDGISWTINGKDITDPQPINLKVTKDTTKEKTAIPDDLITDDDNTIPLVLEHEGNFGFTATLTINLEGNESKYANLYYYNPKTKQLELIDSCVITDGKADLTFTHASDWAIVISDTSAEPDNAPDTGENSQIPVWIIVIAFAVLVVLSGKIITMRLANNKR